MSSALITINFFPDADKKPRLKPIAAELKVTDAFRQASLKFGPFSKEITGEAFIAVICHDPRVAVSLASSLRDTATALEAAAAKAGNPFAR